MWKKLPQEGAELREIRLEGNGTDRDLVILPRSGEAVRFPTAGDVQIETQGSVIVRPSSINRGSLRITFSSSSKLTLERAEVDFDGSELEWTNMWRRARVQSRPWWQEGAGGDEIDLDSAMPATIVIRSS